MDGVKKVSKRQTTMHASSMDHRRVQKSATLNRKFVKKPVAKPKITISAGSASRVIRKTAQQQGQQRRTMIQKQNTVKLQPSQSFKQTAQAQQPQRQQVAQQQQRAVVAQPQKQAQQQQARQGVASRKQIVSEVQQPIQRHQTAQIARARMAARKAAQPEHLSAQELKERAIQQALRKVDQMDANKTMSTQFTGEPVKKAHFWQKKNFGVAAAMAVISFALLGYLVALNLPDISVRVTAMQTGIEKIYPSYVPSNYRLDGLVKEDAGRITMNFKNDDNKTFSLIEEKSSWDSAAVLANYVKKNWGADYSIAKGQGLTIYVSGSKAAWVNGGVFYVISDENGVLSASDLHDIAVSL